VHEDEPARRAVVSAKNLLRGSSLRRCGGIPHCVTAEVYLHGQRKLFPGEGNPDWRPGPVGPAE
jgi:hypothetical protein